VRHRFKVLLSLDLNMLQRQCDLDSFGQPPRADILKAVLAMSGIDPTRRLEELGGSANSELVSLEDAEEALSRTVNFLQNLPEIGSALRQRICQERQIRETDSASLLQVVGHDLPGAVEVVGDIDSSGDDEFATPIVSEKIRFSLAGMQLKFSMIQSGNRFALPASSDTGRWIVKLPGNQFPELPEVEAATMEWARLSGLRWLLVVRGGL
jgi:hypothetical protein